MDNGVKNKRRLKGWNHTWQRGTPMAKKTIYEWTDGWIAPYIVEGYIGLDKGWIND